MTMHSAKGLEFRMVYILDANEGITPHHKAVLDPDMEEKRRMFYVTMTRAREGLHIYHVKERYRKKQVKSKSAEGTEGWMKQGLSRYTVEIKRKRPQQS